MRTSPYIVSVALVGASVWSGTLIAVTWFADMSLGGAVIAANLAFAAIMVVFCVINISRM